MLAIGKHAQEVEVAGDQCAVDAEGIAYLEQAADADAPAVHFQRHGFLRPEHRDDGAVLGSRQPVEHVVVVQAQVSLLLGRNDLAKTFIGRVEGRHENRPYYFWLFGIAPPPLFCIYRSDRPYTFHAARLEYPDTGNVV